MESNTTVLKQSLYSDDPSVRFNAGLDLVKLGDTDGITAVIEGFEHESPVVRLFHAGKALVALGKAAIPALNAALMSHKPQARMAAAHTLYHIDNTQLEALMPVALATLKGENNHAARDALDFLGTAGPAARRAIPALIEALHAPGLVDSASWFEDRRVLVAGLLAKIGEPADEVVSGLVRALQGESEAIRWAAACALGEIGATAKAATSALAARVRDEAEVELVRVEAAYALAVMGDPVSEIIPVLRDACQSADSWLRVFACRILGEMGSPLTPVRSIQEFTWIDRLFMAARDVRHIENPARHVVPMLAAALSDPDYNVRRNAVFALATIGEQAVDAIPALVKTLHGRDIGPVAAEALAKVGETAIPTLCNALQEGNELLSRHALYALKLIGAPAAQDATATAELGVEAFQPAVHHFYVQVSVALDDTKISAFETLYQQALAQGVGSTINYSLPYPKHEFLRYLVEYKGFLLHGSGKIDLDVLRPMRYGIDGADHGNVSGIYADRDFVRPVYFAVIDGKRAFGQHNGFFDLTESGEISDAGDQGFDRRYYKLSIGVNGLRRKPWRNGMIYVLPPDTFVYWHEWTSRSPVRPVMRLAVAPEDLPLRDEVWGADWRKFDGENWVTPTDPFPFLKDARVIPLHPSGRPPWCRRAETW